MSSEETSARLRQMREKAGELANEAEKTTDPKERQRLMEKSRRLRSRSEQESGMRSGDIYPSE
ncbi:DUF6381 family protein [Streptomyces montanisoli]|uniref:Small hydrophilic protein n=1 Tax=Streptomyces montanisoli TaxID=2798581 RepID=A0A940M842_9ACTN|nr:DUF6381 family protein [Streptomyces montanisoli]MBP0456529.1 small hydrophilic protein [Streptomyces montanisoli]